MKSKSKILTRSLALLLAVLIGFYAIPSTVFAAFGGKENPTDATIEAAAEESHGTTDTREIYEVTDSRRESVKLF